MELKGIDVAKEGFSRASLSLNENANKIANGDISAATFVDFAMSANDVQIQTKNLGFMIEKDENLLDIIA